MTRLTDEQVEVLENAVQTMLAVNMTWEDRRQAAERVKDVLLGGRCPICQTPEWDAYTVGLCEANMHEDLPHCPLCDTDDFIAADCEAAVLDDDFLTLLEDTSRRDELERNSDG